MNIALQLALPRARKKVAAATWLLIAAIGTGGCGQQAAPEVEWPEFGRALLQNLKAKDIESLKQQSATLADAKRMWRAFQANDSSLEDLDPKMKEADIAISNQSAIGQFLQMHATYLGGEPAVIGIDPKPNSEVELYDVIVWVKHDGKYRGLPLPTVYRSPGGLKVSDWSSGAASDNKPRQWEEDTIDSCKSKSKLAYDL
jgi:hypothetical protein